MTSWRVSTRGKIFLVFLGINALSGVEHLARFAFQRLSSSAKTSLGAAVGMLHAAFPVLWGRMRISAGIPRPLCRRRIISTVPVSSRCIPAGHSGTLVREMANIRADKAALAAFCRKHHILRLAFFGSVLREDFSPESDVDVLAEFEPGYPVGFLRLAEMQMELSRILGREVDLRTPAELSRYFRDEVIRSAEIQYAER